MQFNDTSELVFSHKIEFSDASDTATNVCYYIQAKSFIITSRKGENVAITSRLKQFGVTGNLTKYGVQP